MRRGVVQWWWFGVRFRRFLGFPARCFRTQCCRTQCCRVISCYVRVFLRSSDNILLTLLPIIRHATLWKEATWVIEMTFSWLGFAWEYRITRYYKVSQKKREGLKCQPSLISENHLSNNVWILILIIPVKKEFSVSNVQYSIFNELFTDYCTPPCRQY